MTDVIRGSKELLLVAERMAGDKGIPVDSIIQALEDGIKLAARKKFGHDLDVKCSIDRKNGNINLYNLLEIIPDDYDGEVNSKKQIKLSDAAEFVSGGRAMFQETVNVGESVSVKLPPVDLNRLVVQVAKNEINRKIKEAEKEKEYNDFIGKVGTIVYGIVKKTGQRKIVVEVDGYETLLRKDNLIPGEYFRVGDRVKAYVADVVRDNDNQIFLSRIDNNFLVELMKQEIPEMYDGLIEARAVARDPGSKAKVVVYSRDNIADVVGLCVGARGSKIQAVSSELRGEKIDVIKWSEEEGVLIANLLTPAKINKVVINDKANTRGEVAIDAVMAEDQMNLAIGRGGQNIRLACKIIGNRINIMTEVEEKQKRANEFNDLTILFSESLDVEEIIAQLLIAEGYLSIEKIAAASVEDLQKIEGFDEDIAAEIRARAEEFLNERRPTSDDKKIGDGENKSEEEEEDANEEEGEEEESGKKEGEGLKYDE
ncbi:MAG: transcription termination factor NusA [Rickettsiales bacterium]|jgi:N utilization substance protein A|nr:transcription termination factor NusA [Rickettsiales bacterium]